MASSKRSSDLHATWRLPLLCQPQCSHLKDGVNRLTSGGWNLAALWALPPWDKCVASRRGARTVTARPLSPTHRRVPGRGGPGVHKDAASWPRSGEGALRRGSHPPVVRLRKRRESQEPGLPGPGALRPGLRLQEAGWRERPARGWEKPEL